MLGFCSSNASVVPCWQLCFGLQVLHTQLSAAGVAGGLLMSEHMQSKIMTPFTLLKWITSIARPPGPPTPISRHRTLNFQNTSTHYHSVMSVAASRSADIDTWKCTRFWLQGVCLCRKQVPTPLCVLIRACGPVFQTR